LLYLISSKHITTLVIQPALVSNSLALWIQRTRAMGHILCMLSVFCIAHCLIDYHLWHIFYLVNYFSP